MGVARFVVQTHYRKEKNYTKSKWEAMVVKWGCAEARERGIQRMGAKLLFSRGVSRRQWTLWVITHVTGAAIRCLWRTG